MQAPSRRMLVSTAAALLGIGTAGGGAVLAATEGYAYLEGVWMAFAVVSTTGFGDGPTTPPGMIVAMILFGLAVVAYVLLLVAAGEAALRRAETSRPQPRPEAIPATDVARIMRELSRN